MENSIKHFDIIEHLIELTTQEAAKTPYPVKIYTRIAFNLENIEIAFNKILNDETLTEKGKQAYTTAIEVGLGKFSSAIEISGIEPTTILSLLIYTNYLHYIFQNCSQVKDGHYITKNLSGNFSFLKSDNEITFQRTQEALFKEDSTPAEIFIREFSRNAGIRFIAVSENAEYYAQTGDSLQVFADSFCSKKIKIDTQTLDFVEKDSRLFFDLTFWVNDRSKKASNLFYPIYTIIGALEQINNITSSIQEISKGSLLTKIFLWADDLLAKEEVKETLKNVQENLIYEENKQKQLEIAPQPDIFAFQAVDFPTMVREYEQILKLTKPEPRDAIELRKLELAEKKLLVIKKISELVTHAILTTDEMVIDLNNIEFIKITNGKIHISQINIDEITE